MDAETRDALVRAKEQLDRFDFYPRPVSLRGVRILIVPLLFRFPWFSRFDGYALHRTILLRSRCARMIESNAGKNRTGAFTRASASGARFMS